MQFSLQSFSTLNVDVDKWTKQHGWYCYTIGIQIYKLSKKLQKHVNPFIHTSIVCFIGRFRKGKKTEKILGKINFYEFVKSVSQKCQPNY